MTIPSQSAQFSFAPQAQKFGKDAPTDAFVVADHTWYTVRAPRVAVMSQQVQQTLPPETGGPITPNGAYKTMAFYGGDVDAMPRLEEAVLYLFYGTMGKHTSYADSNWSATETDNTTSGSTGTFLHKFVFDAANTFEQPWMAVRCKVPGRTAAENSGDIGVDSKISALTLTIPGAGLLQMNTVFLGRCPKFPTPTEVNAWAYANTLEDSLSIPNAGKGRFLIGGVEYPITSAQIVVANNLTNPQQEMVVGDYYPDDFIALTRNAQIQVVYKWENADLHRQLYTGRVDGVEWDSLPFSQKTSGATMAFEGLFQSSGNIPGSSPAVPYEMRVIANHVTWAVQPGSMELQAGGIIQLTLVGTILEPLDGSDYLEIWVRNGKDLAWHKAPVFELGVSTINFTESDGATNLTAAATLTSGLTNFNGGKLVVSTTSNGDSADVISVQDIGTNPTEIGLSTAEVQYGGSAIGDIDATNDGTAGKPLEIVFDTADATPTAVLALIEAIQWNTGSSPSEATRVVEFRVEDGSTGISEDEIRVYVTATT